MDSLMSVERSIRIVAGVLTAFMLAVLVAVVVFASQASSAADTANLGANAAHSALSQVRAAASTAVHAEHTSVSAEQLAQAIQASRVQQCRLENVRHRDTVRVLQGEFAAATRKAKHRGVAIRATLAATKRATMRVINAITPFHNCQTSLGAP